MKIAVFRRPRNVVILILVLLASLHFLLFLSQNYSIKLLPANESAAPSTNWLAVTSPAEDAAFFRDISAELADEIRSREKEEEKEKEKDEKEEEEEKDKEKEKEKVKEKEKEKEKERIEWIDRVPPHVREFKSDLYQLDGFERPPHSKVIQVFGDDIILNQENEFVQKPNLKKGFNPLDGRVELLPKSNGIKKYTSFGNAAEHTCEQGYCYINERRVKKEILKETPEDMFTFLPPPRQFMAEFRNPCWKAEDLEGEEKLFCIPYFYIIGFTKCGTTDMFAILKNHTLVSSRAGKETHYFDRLRRGRIIRMNRKPTRLPVSFMSWTNAGKFRQNLISTYKRVEDSDVLFHGITMDATPAHVWDNEYWEIFHPGYREPPVTNADVIATINPKSKIIVSLRNPISRMQSAYQFFCAFHVYPCDTPVTPLKFHSLVVDALDMFNTCLKTNTPRGCVYSTDNHQLATHLYASLYSIYLTDWLALFPRHQVHVIMFEEHISDEIHSINSVCDFLEISRFPVEYMEKYLEEHKVRNSLPDEKRIPYMLPQTQLLLKDFFKPYLDDLVHTLGDDKWYWDLY